MAGKYDRLCLKPMLIIAHQAFLTAIDIPKPDT